MSDLQATFNLFAENGKMNKKNLGNLLRSLHLFPIEKEIEAASAELAEEITLTEVQKILDGANFDKRSYEELKEALAMFDDDNTGLISILDLKHILTGLGEPMSEQEFEDLCKMAHVEVVDGKIDYDLFVKKVLY